MSAPFQIINLDKPRKLRLGIREAIEYEKAFGKKINEHLVTGIGATDAVNLLWIMLKKEEPGLTVDNVIDLVDNNTDDMDEVFDKVFYTVLKALGAKPDPNAQATADHQNS